MSLLLVENDSQLKYLSPSDLYSFMAITLTREDYDELWQEQNPDPKITFHSGFSEHRLVVPERLGQGYMQIMQWHDIDLTVFNYQFYDDVHVMHRAEDLTPQLGEIGFHLSGNRSGKRTGENFIEWGYCDSSDKWTSTTYAGEPILKVDIGLDYPNLLSQVIVDTLQDLPTEVRQCLEDWDENWLYEINTITPAMRLPLERIFHCPFQGRTKQIYLEGNCLELIALKLEQLKEIDKRTGLSCSLKPDDIERIHLAESILMSNLSDPPSLMQLAHQVGLNDYKLKVGYRQVFGTTVFGYLHQRRMELARQLLSEQRMRVKDVAQTVGYISQSQFAKAFRRQFGVNPKAYTLGKI